MIHTEIDANEEKPSRLSMAAGTIQGKRNLMDPSQTMLTDHDITDEVGQAFGHTIKQ